MMVADVQPKATTWSGIFGRMRATLRAIRRPMAHGFGQDGKVVNNFPPCRKQFIEKLPTIVHRGRKEMAIQLRSGSTSRTRRISSSDSSLFKMRVLQIGCDHPLVKFVDPGWR
jgi:hypothetical protein